jgi:uncharacterized protein
MHYLLFYEYVDDYVARRTPLRAEHLALLQKSHEKGDAVMAGALAEPHKGAVLVFRGESSAAAESFAKNDPYVKGGLVTKWEVKKWATVLGDGAEMPKLT